MPAGSGQLSLAFQWDTPSWVSVPGLWDFLFAWLDRRPVNWNLPAFPQETVSRRRPSLGKPLLGRIGPGGDSATSMGFSGAFHRLLSVDELDREVSWGLHNPWGTGITDVLGLKARTLIPREADLAREEAWRVYRGHGFGLIGVHGVAARPQAPPEGCLELLSVHAASWRPQSTGAQALRRAVARAAAGRGTARVIVDLSGLSDAGPLRALLEDPSGLFSARTATLRPLPEPVGDLPVRPPASAGLPRAAAWSAVLLPDLRAALEATAALSQKRRKKNEEYGTLLGALGSPGSHASRGPRTAPARDPGQQLVAHMLGEVSLTGTAFDVRLRGGRFSGVLRRGDNLLPDRPARSFYRVGRSLRALCTVTSVSFETDHGTGLREELAVREGEPSIARIEYAFHDGCPDLIISVDASYPELPAGAELDEYAPVALALLGLRRDETATVEAFAPDGSASSVVISETDGSVLVPGSQHKVRRTDGGWIVLGFSPGGRSWGLPSFRITRVGRGRFLECNPLGSAVPVAAERLRGAGARLSMTLGLE